MGLRAEIYKSKYGSASNGGLSETCNTVTIVNAEGPASPSPAAPAVLIVKGNVPNSVKAVAAELETGMEAYGGNRYKPIAPTDMVGPMNGGCIINTSDSRLGELVERLRGPRFAAVPLHDRFESAALYASMD